MALLDSLQELNLFQNRLATLPKEIKWLKQLKEIILTDNPVDSEAISEVEKKLPSTNKIY